MLTNLVTRSLMREPDLDYCFYWQMVGLSLTNIVMHFKEFFLERMLSSALFLSALRVLRYITPLLKMDLLHPLCPHVLMNP